MADEELDGLLSQDDIDAALSETGMSGGESTPEPTAAEPPPAVEGELSQADIDATLGAAGGQPQDGAAPTPEPAVETPEETRVDATGRPFDEVAAAMAAAIDAEGGDEPETPAPQTTAPPPGSRPVDIPELDARRDADGPEIQGIDLLSDVDLNVKIELGRCRMLVDDVLRLGEGAVVELDKLAGDPVDVYVNDRLVARGEVLVLNDNFCVRINDIVSRDLKTVEA